MNNKDKFDNQTQYSKFWSESDGVHSWLEDVQSETALDWVKLQNKSTLETLGEPDGNPLFSDILTILDSKDKIPHVSKIGLYYYNFWKDEKNKRGVLRRTTWESYNQSNPLWEVVIDVDVLCEKEANSYVYKGYSVHEPEDVNDVPHLALVYLSIGGSDATIIREFDLNTLQFIPESDGGFIVPEAKSRVSYKTKDILLIGTDFKNDSSMTDSGYPRVVYEWHRHTNLFTDATLVYEGERTDVSVSGYVSKHNGFKFEVRSRGLTFYTSTKQVSLLSDKYLNSSNPHLCGSNMEGILNVWHELKIPIDADLYQFSDCFLIYLRSDWNVLKTNETPLNEMNSIDNNTAILSTLSYKSGSLIAVNALDFIANSTNATSFYLLFEPTDRISYDSHIVTKNYIVIQVLDNVKSRLIFTKYNPIGDASGSSDGNADGAHMKWTYIGSEADATIRGASLQAVDENYSDEFFCTSSSFLTPFTLSIADASVGIDCITNSVKLKSLPNQFDSTDIIEIQYEAISSDGTAIPYFVIMNKNIAFDGTNCTLLYGYGGFEISLTPSYLSVTGKGWLERGGVYVNANIRGGGEFGAKWHQAALKENRYLAYDDFIAVAEDLISRGITSSSKLAIRGGSNGGLLMGNMMVRRPDLFGCIVCQVPLLDMHRYSHLLAGASWMAEYGDPDTEDWNNFLHKYSAYHNIAFDIESKKLIAHYPPLLMTTSTKDDRVHPYHARSFVKRFEDIKNIVEDDMNHCNISDVQVHAPSNCPKVFYYENIEGGHGGAADNKQTAYLTVLYLQFVERMIGPLR